MGTEKAIVDYVALYRSLGLDGVGCTQRELAEIEAKWGTSLPASYRGFMQVVGRGGFHPWIGSDYTYPTVLDARDWLLESHAEGGACTELPGNHLVVLSHQGYQFLALEADGSEDPPVVRYSETPGEVARVAARFSDLIRETSSLGPAGH